MSAIPPKEHGLIFQGWGVRAILAGAKTQTRRAPKSLDVLNENLEEHWFVDSAVRSPGEGTRVWCVRGGRKRGYLKPPYGDVGDLIYVKETWAPTTHPPRAGQIVYRADLGKEGMWKWRSSMLMPKRLARIWLRITDVRLQRIGRISATDVHAEGVRYTNGGWHRDGLQVVAATTAQIAYLTVWNSINRGKPLLDAHRSPWAWAYTFERVRRMSDEPRRAATPDGCKLPDLPYTSR